MSERHHHDELERLARHGRPAQRPDPAAVRALAGRVRARQTAMRAAGGVLALALVAGGGWVVRDRLPLGPAGAPRPLPATAWPSSPTATELPPEPQPRCSPDTLRAWDDFVARAHADLAAGAGTDRTVTLATTARGRLTATLSGEPASATSPVDTTRSTLIWTPSGQGPQTLWADSPVIPMLGVSDGRWIALAGVQRAASGLAFGASLFVVDGAKTPVEATKIPLRPEDVTLTSYVVHDGLVYGVAPQRGGVEMALLVIDPATGTVRELMRGISLGSVQGDRLLYRPADPDRSAAVPLREVRFDANGIHPVERPLPAIEAELSLVSSSAGYAYGSPGTGTVVVAGDRPARLDYGLPAQLVGTMLLIVGPGDRQVLMDVESKRQIQLPQGVTVYGDTVMVTQDGGGKSVSYPTSSLPPLC